MGGARASRSSSPAVRDSTSTAIPATRCRGVTTCCGCTRSPAPNSASPNRDGLEQLHRLGGFPEPFLSGSEVAARRWSRSYGSRLVHEDLRDLERIHDLGNLERLLQRLPDQVGSPLSINAVREDLQVNHKTATHWLT